MDPDYLVFARIAAEGSLSAAGRAMLISPAMISRRLARLEARLGVQLFHRSTRRLALTAAGERFHADVAAILRSIGEAEARVTGAQAEPSGSLRVSAPTSFGRLHVTPRLGEFLDLHPQVRLELDLSDGYADLFAGRFDLAIRIATAVPPSLEAHRLGGSRRILCASPAYLDRAGVPAGIGALAGHRLLAATGQLPWRLVNGRRRRTVDGVSHVRTNSSEVVRELAVAGVGIALRSLWDVGPMLADGSLVPLLPGWEGPGDLAVLAVRPRGLPSPAVGAFVAFLQRAFASADWDRPD